MMNIARVRAQSVFMRAGLCKREALYHVHNAFVCAARGALYPKRTTLSRTVVPLSYFIHYAIARYFFFPKARRAQQASCVECALRPAGVSNLRTHPCLCEGAHTPLLPQGAPNAIKLIFGHVIVCSCVSVLVWRFRYY